ncbi:head maturation protease, ClpP-related [Brevibacillus laterosporus]|uniref:ATP-dependent Clp protease proteolytic subunit n=1 Tax=Brevibacillus laterosporus TaxID=1465 RepID=A0AAP3DD23_BRELA|nr:head maturation protease, ClpP-related [Brevibacillus laterosporus]MCR8978651.1 Clp protease ClpP [Brevibacillus laterosporus]MCZ0805807.1 Clp protease ClpP [Brevibacillus laterosporus]MCZ0824427.1 Clp protease ClpP [Brevibacillus laterosporus]MCZ0848331.1 Clp protease ClpP [Brevibacillus laterosporus]
MAKKIMIKGAIVSNNDYSVYEWLDIEATSPKIVHEQLAVANGQPVEVEINSGGGDVFAGSEIYSALRAYSMNGGYVGINIVGLAASAASVIAMAGDVVRITPVGQIMIHNARINGASGDYRDMNHMSGVLKNVNQTLANAYRLKTGKTEAELLSMLDDETWLTPEQALRHGFVDVILFDDKVQSESIGARRSQIASHQTKKMAAQLNLMKLKVGI